MDGNVEIKQVDTVKKYEAILYDGDDVVSFGAIIINFLEDDLPFGLIENIWTHPNFRGHGYATKITNMLIKKAKEHGCYKCLLSCSDQNMSLYLKLGFYIHQNNMRLNL